MIVVGDIACPDVKCAADLKNIFNQHNNIFGSKTLLCNFEGLVCDDISPDTVTPVLYNHSSVLPVLQEANTKVAALANNHTLDLPGCFNASLKQLQQFGILPVGAALCRQKALAPVSFFDEGVEIICFNQCWDFLLYHQTNPTESVHVAEIDIQQLLTAISTAKLEKPSARIVVYLHWSFDLEVLPFPMYRQMAMAMVDAGASVVMGTHSHCVQGGEKYKDAYIVYGLGNFFLPYNKFANGKLSFPEFSRMQLAFEWHPHNNAAYCHWFYYISNKGHHQLELKESAAFEQSLLLKEYSPFNALPGAAYTAYFKRKRRKKMLIPVYTDYKAVVKNKLFTVFLKSRAKLARLLAKYKIIKWQS
jgi:hypothetical protein